MKDNFIPSLKLVLIDEGGNDDDPDDHGGRTSRGITQREYTAWLHEHNRPFCDVWNAPFSDVETIYHDEYWMPWCDLWPIGADYCIFDMNVNAGPYRCTTLIQRALSVREDGRIGPITRAAILSAAPVDFINRFSDVKRKWYQALNQPKFTRGWLNRTEHVRKGALEMVKGATNAII